MNLKPYLIAVLLIINLSAKSQSESKRDNAIRIFIDCPFCDVDHFRKELTYVNYVRDRKDAQVYVLTTREFTGASGIKQTFFFLGQLEFKGQADTLSFAVTSDATEDEIRTRQINLLKLGLVRYVAKTPFADKLTIVYEEGEKTESITDKWNSWVFELNCSGYFYGEQSYKYLSSWSSFNIKRVTESLKVEIDMNYSFNQRTFLYDDTTIYSTNNSKSFNNLLVASINEHWSYGYDVNMRSSLYQNLDFSGSLYPAIEYNLFPYSKSNRKQLRFLYGAGGRYFNYIDTTIYEKTQELLFGQKLGIAAEFKEKWGSISASLEGSHYFHDIKFKRLQFYTFLNLRLFKGLSLRLNGGVSLIHDQINLPKGDVSREDVLLQRRQLASQYDYWGSVGISYSFGSIYNNVVNPRFGN